FQAEDGIRDRNVTGVQTCALPISGSVVTRDDAVKIRAEEGRRIERTDVSPFVRNLPTGADTGDFRSDNASGSTSQAANICEAVEIGRASCRESGESWLCTSGRSEE